MSSSQTLPASSTKPLRAASSALATTPSQPNPFPFFPQADTLGPHTNARNSISLIRLLHTSLYTAGWGLQPSAISKRPPRTRLDRRSSKKPRYILPHLVLPKWPVVPAFRTPIVQRVPDPLAGKNLGQPVRRPTLLPRPRARSQVNIAGSQLP